MYSKKELRCILSDPAYDPSKPNNAKLISNRKFAALTYTIFDEPEHKKTLGKSWTLKKFKKLKLLPPLLVRIILQEAGINFQE